MKTQSPPPVRQRVFLAVLILLAAIAIYLLLEDLGRGPAGESRIDWPPPSGTKP